MRSMALALLGTALLTTSVMAQQASNDGHSGFHAAIGVGEASWGVTCDGCSTDRSSSEAIMLRFGGAIGRGVVLSAELNGSAKVEGNATRSESWLNAVVQWYPQPAQGFYFKGGVGVAALYGTGFVEGVGSTEVRTTNLGLEGGVGYDIHLSHGFSITPYADFLYAAPADAMLNGSSTGVNVGGNLVHVGLAASWR